MKRIALFALVVYLGLFAAGRLMAAATLTTLHVFQGTDGNAPVAPLILGPDGAFYGTTQVGGGVNGMGTVFKLTVQTTTATNISCVLSPASATNAVGTVHTVTSNGVPRSSVLVSFSVTAGPNLGQNGSATTSASGQASFSYTGGTTPGTDTIRAASLGATGTATKVWVAPDSVGDGIPDWWRAQYFGRQRHNNQRSILCDL